jgi:hypothetical protein
VIFPCSLVTRYEDTDLIFSAFTSGQITTTPSVFSVMLAHFMFSLTDVPNFGI